MAETEQVHAEESSNEEDNESPEPHTSRFRRFKDSNISFGEMVEMVDILKRADYDGKHGPYPNPNVRKAKIMTKVVKSLRWNFGVRRSKDQLRKCWSDLKLREHDQYRRIKRVLQKSDVDIVEEEAHFTSASAHVLIGEIMLCNPDLPKIKEDINDVEKRLKNITDVLGRI
ncbi:hypothetical protein AB205_0044990 [Aquarana catesbeiana]|uniref:Myb/SANT-like DNA-binding domain-containing protein n=1 Tax=Aquarana catesbeiana TaxID=8400 RepID=A0A2G9R763_AQUCT|nr:hypothetical protein AB205_0044990 [Aquarana catesbeiana]